MLAKVAETNSDLAAQLQALAASAGSQEEKLEKLFDGTLIKALIAWAIANPDQVTAMIRFILALFGVVLPPLPSEPAKTEE